MFIKKNVLILHPADKSACAFYRCHAPQPPQRRKRKMANSETLKTLDLFRDQLVLEADFQFGYAVTLRQNGGKALISGVGSSPQKAMEDLAAKWEKG